MLPLTALQPSHIQAYYGRMLESGRLDGKGGLSAQTVKHHHRVLYEALKHAVKHGLLIRNVGEAVDPPRPDGKEMSTLELDDVRTLLNAARETPYYTLFYTAIYTAFYCLDVSHKSRERTPDEHLSDCPFFHSICI